MPQCPHCATHQSAKEICGWCGKQMCNGNGHDTGAIIFAGTSQQHVLCSRCGQRLPV